MEEENARSDETSVYLPLIVQDGANIIHRHPGERTLRALALSDAFWATQGFPILSVLPLGMEKCACSAEEEAWLQQALSRGALLLAPCAQRGDDDLFSLSLAMRHDAYLVSNDRFADQKERVAGAAGCAPEQVQAWLDDRVITFAWAGDNFVPHPLAATRAFKDARGAPPALLRTVAGASAAPGPAHDGDAMAEAPTAAPPAPAVGGGGGGAALLVPIPARAAGAVIGRGGATIRQIQARTGAHVDVPREDDAGGASIRTVVITGTPAACEAARAEVLAALAGGDANALPPGHVAFHAGIPDDRAGALIGKGGATIRDLQDRTGCRVSVAATADATGLRLVAITGPLPGVELAKAELEAIAARR
jgi:hypothetical protein